MSSAIRKSFITPEEYLALDRAAEFRSEYFNGQMFPVGESPQAMAGSTIRHNRIAGNLYGELYSQLKNGPCEPYISDIRVHAGSTGLYTYPDIAVVCGDPQLLDGEFDTLLNPTVIVEILSPSTEAWDRGGKFAHFRQLESTNDYILVNQHRILVEHYVRQGDGWLLTTLKSLDDTLQIASIGCIVALRDIYAKVTFPADA